MGGRTKSDISRKPTPVSGGSPTGVGSPGDACPDNLLASVAGPVAGISAGSWLEVRLDRTSSPSRAVFFDLVSGLPVGAMVGVPNLARFIQCLVDGV